MSAAGLSVAAGVARRCFTRRRVAARAVAAAPGRERDHDNEEENEGDDTKRLHPARRALRVLAVLVRHCRHFTLHTVFSQVRMYDGASPRILRRVPKLWNETIESHRRTVRDAILDTTAALVGEHGLRSVTMAQIAEETGIGRATLYKYFADVDTILRAWHERQIAAHLDDLADVRDNATDAAARLEAVLDAYARIIHESHGRHNAELAAFLHRDPHVARARKQLRDMIRELLADAAAAGDVRTDVAPDELAGYCLHALSAASSLPSKAAVRRLVAVTLAGLRSPLQQRRGRARAEGG